MKWSHLLPEKRVEPLLNFKCPINIIACENIRFSSLFAAGDVLRGETSATQQQKFHTDDVKSVGNPSEALIGQRSSYIVLAIVCE